MKFTEIRDIILDLMTTNDYVSVSMRPEPDRSYTVMTIDDTEAVEWKVDFHSAQQLHGWLIYKDADTNNLTYRDRV